MSMNEREERAYNRGRDDVLGYLRFWLDYDEFRSERLLFSEKDTKVLREKIDEMRWGKKE